ncbi:hypothetical protein B0J14DRAFT_470174 [Halenospora varia]|nr:hypothetical protein B0J14DRAFT_470174 [Halenospora varia]
MSWSEHSTTSSPPLRVAIIGAGIGGLVLAQLLRNAPRFTVTVYERSARNGGISHLAGFRIFLSLEMLTQLRVHLPPEVVDLMEKAIGVQPHEGQDLTLMDEKGNVKFRYMPKDFRDARSVSRMKLRTALLEGLDYTVNWETRFRYYEQLKHGLRVHFEDGTNADYDLLVGADGAGSRVRQQLLPDSTRDSLGVTVLYFKIPLTPETEAMLPFGSGCMVMAPRQSMVVSYYKDPARPYGPYNLESIHPDVSFLMVGLGCYTNEFVDQSKHPDEMTPEELKDDCLARARNWNPLFKALIANTVPESVFVSHIKTQHRFKPWESENVTLLGDAAHSMTPYLGKGATSAIFDSLTLAQHLKSFAEYESAPLPAYLHAYEAKMLKYGFLNLEKSRKMHDLVFMGSSAAKARWRNRMLKVLDVVVGVKAPKEQDFPGK